LKEFGLTDIFPLLGQQQKTGVLNLQEGSKVVQVLFEKGMIVGTAFPTEADDEPPLAKRLIRGALLSPEKWKKAYKQHKDELTGIEQTLLNNGMVIKEDLVAVLRLLTFETIYGLFKWKGGSFRFEAKKVLYDSNLVEPLASEYLLLDVLRMVDEWPLLAERIPGFDIVLRKKDPMASLDVLAGTPWEKKRTFQMEVLYELIDGQRTIQEVMDLSFIGEFDTCKNLIMLTDAGMIEPLSHSVRRKKGKKFEAPRQLMDVWAYLLTAGLAFFLIFQFSTARWADFPLSQEERKGWMTFQEPLQKIERLKTMNAREVFFLEENRYPNQPAELVDRGLLAPQSMLADRHRE
jgi:hypothetical protein